MDMIRIEGLLLRMHIGVTEEERRDRQDVLVDLTLYTDTRLPGQTDRIEDVAVNYRTVAKGVIAMAETSRFNLVEKCAAEIAALCLTEPGVERVRVSVDKPGALRFARSAGITIERSRNNG